MKAGGGSVAVDGSDYAKLQTSFYNDAVTATSQFTVGCSKEIYRIKSVRLYNRQLTATEAAMNAAVDEARFALKPVDENGNANAFEDAAFYSTKASTSNIILTQPVAATNKASYTVMLRFKVESRVNPDPEATGKIQILQLGYGWSANSGLYLQLCGPADNLYVRAYHGSIADDFKDMQNDPDKTLKIGEWVDMALTVNGNKNVLYYKTESGKWYEGSQNTNVGLTGSTSELYKLAIGGPIKTKNNDVIFIGTSVDVSVTPAFRGWYQQVVIWDRALTRDEVLNAFCDGCSEVGDFQYLGRHNGGAPASAEPDSKSSIHIGTSSGANSENWSTEKVEQFRGWVHQAAVWPYALSEKEVRAVFGFPSPEVARIGVENGSLLRLYFTTVRMRIGCFGLNLSRLIRTAICSGFSMCCRVGRRMAGYRTRL